MQTELLQLNGALAPADSLDAIDKFAARLNEAPPAPEIQINSAAGNSKYLPVSFVQMKLDEIFLGLWSWEVKGVQVIANEILVHGDLTVFHPSAKTWLKRSGTGAAMIQQSQGAAVNDVNSKIKNTMGKDFPHAEAEALKSAAKKFGKLFGRDLNRKFEDQYDSEYFEAAPAGIDTKELQAKISKCKDLKALMTLYKSDPRHEQLADLFSARKNELKA